MLLFYPLFQTIRATPVGRVIQTAATNKAFTDLVGHSFSVFYSMYWPSTNNAILEGTDGGLADYMVVSASNARKLPPGITLDIAGT